MKKKNEVNPKILNKLSFPNSIQNSKEKEDTKDDSLFKNFNLETLIQIEESLSSINLNLNNPKSINLDLSITYIKNLKYQKIYETIPNVLKNTLSNEEISLIIIPYINLQLISVFIIFILISSNKVRLKLNFNHLKNLLSLVLNNFYFIIQIFLFKITKENFVNVWTHQLQNLIFKKSSQSIPKKINLIPNLIKRTNKLIIEQIKLIHTTNKTIFNECYPKLKYIYNLYETKPTEFFLELIEKYLSSEKFNTALTSSPSKKLNRCLSQSIYELKSISDKTLPEEDESEVLLSVKYPFLPCDVLTPRFVGVDGKTDYHLTVVLDLDETLISFKMEDSNEKGLLRMRPGLIEFLEALKKLNVESVVFTAATQDYADPIIDAIEAEEKFFLCRLYRQHSVIINNEFVKDLSKLGRDLGRVIIVDNNEKNFILQQ
ncbi:MAG: HAD family hydrolase, partial [archaeon]|nr:HAD family hydrolase [archaeon]